MATGHSGSPIDVRRTSVRWGNDSKNLEMARSPYSSGCLAKALEMMKRLLVICMIVLAYSLFTSVDNGYWIQNYDDDHPHELPILAVFSNYHEVRERNPPQRNSGCVNASLAHLDTVLLLM